MKQYVVTGMTCASCQLHVEKAVAKVPGVNKVTVSLLTNSMAVDGTAEAGDVIRAVEDAGYGAKPKGAEEKVSSSAKLAAEEDALKDRETPRLRRRLILSVAFLAILMYFTMGYSMLNFPLPSFFDQNFTGLALTQMLLALAVMIINKDFFVSGFRSLMHGAPNMDSLVALGSGVSYLWSLYVFYKMTYLMTAGANAAAVMDLYHNQLYFESAAMIPALITVGKMLESLSKGHTTDALKNLMKMAPKTAVLERNGESVTVDIDEVKAGDIFLVRPGEAVPVDGVILEGSTAIDESALTGESIPVDKTVDDTVKAATINQSGFIKARATRIGEDTTFSQIIQMVSDAAATKAPIARIADVVSSFFVPAVIILAVLVAAVWFFFGAPAAKALEYAICVLVISCPCALGLATPVSIMVGNGLGAKNGILFKTGEALENAGKLQIVALDKTGTITEGKPEVTDVYPAEGTSEDELLRLAYSLEKKSEHPLARAIVKKGEEENISFEEAEDFQALPGNGLIAKIGNKTVRGGSESYISGLVSLPEEIKEKSALLGKEGKTPLFFEREGKFLGIIAVADVIKEDSAKAVKELQKMGIEVVMLTGDNERTARAIGDAAGVDRVIAGVLPDGKEAVIRELQKRGKVGMVGDGINDAPALTRADIGVAIGSGTDVAIDSADIVLMNSRLTDVSGAVRLSRGALRNIHENLFWAFAYNVLLIPVAAGIYPGISLNPMMAAAAMALSSVTVCLNALRLNLFKVHDSSHDKALKNKALPAGAETVKENISSSAEESKQDEESKKSEAEKPVSEKKDSVHQAIVSVGGMTCENCDRHVKKALESVEGIIEATADHKTGQAVIRYDGNPDEEKMKEALSQADYEYKGITFEKEESKKSEAEKPVSEKKDNLRQAIVSVGGMTCENCDRHVKKALESVEGIIEAAADHKTGQAVITYDNNPDEEKMKEALSQADYEYKGITFPKEENNMKETVKIEGMTCSHCEMTVKKALEALDGVESAAVSHEKGTAELSLSKDVAEQDIKKAIEDKDYKLSLIHI